jgi:hypothetical protein
LRPFNARNGVDGRDKPGHDGKGKGYRSRLAMLDKWEKTQELIATLKASAPFEVELTPPLIAQLRASTPPFDVEPRQIVTGVSYCGDEGGILCHIEPHESDQALVVSLTHLRLRRSLPFAAAVFDYQKHRTKKLKKQNRTV